MMVSMKLKRWLSPPSIGRQVPGGMEEVCGPDKVSRIKHFSWSRQNWDLVSISLFRLISQQLFPEALWILPVGRAVVTHPAGIVSAACESLASQGAVAPGRGRFLVRLIPQWRLCCVCLIRDCCFLYWCTKYKWRSWSNILEVANVRSQ